MSISSEEFGAMKEKIDNIETTVNKLDTKLFGNGNPGIVIDMINLTTTITNLADKVISISTQITEIDKRPIVKTWLEKNWKSLLFSLTLFFLLIHSIIPADVNIWTLIQKIF